MDGSDESGWTTVSATRSPRAAGAATHRPTAAAPAAIGGAGTAASAEVAAATTARDRLAASAADTAAQIRAAAARPPPPHPVTSKDESFACYAQECAAQRGYTVIAFPDALEDRVADAITSAHALDRAHARIPAGEFVRGVRSKGMRALAVQERLWLSVPAGVLELEAAAKGAAVCVNAACTTVFDVVPAAQAAKRLRDAPHVPLAAAQRAALQAAVRAFTVPARAAADEAAGPRLAATVAGSDHHKRRLAEALAAPAAAAAAALVGGATGGAGTAATTLAADQPAASVLTVAVITTQSTIILDSGVTTLVTTWRNATGYGEWRDAKHRAHAAKVAAGAAAARAEASPAGRKASPAAATAAAHGGKHGGGAVAGKRASASAGDPKDRRASGKRS